MEYVPAVAAELGYLPVFVVNVILRIARIWYLELFEADGARAYFSFDGSGRVEIARSLLQKLGHHGQSVVVSSSPTGHHLEASSATRHHAHKVAAEEDGKEHEE